MSRPGFTIRVDRAACHGSAACVRRAPRTFALDGERKSRVVDPPGDDEATIRSAANTCPYFAIDVRARESAPDASVRDA